MQKTIFLIGALTRLDEHYYDNTARKKSSFLPFEKTMKGTV